MMDKNNLKVSSYQKLKLKNQELIDDIYTLVINPDTEKGVITRLSYNLKFMEDEQLLSGDGV